MKGRIRQRSPGSWQISYELGRDALGKRKTRSITVRGTKAEAQRKLREVLTALDNGGIPEPADLPLRQWLDRWMDEVITPARRLNTADRYRRAIRNHILPHIGNIPLSKFGPAQVQALETRVGREVGPQTVNLVHVILSGAFRHAMRLELIHRNPGSLVSPPPAKRRGCRPS